MWTINALTIIVPYTVKVLMFNKNSLLFAMCAILKQRIKKIMQYKNWK